jgi:NAD(P)-dependent dehydrogenase (short-subunit alcohol dehydrogenase family)
MSIEHRGPQVALVAGATRGAGRAIAVELARAGLDVYATGRSSRKAGRSEIGRPETIEEFAGQVLTARQLADRYGVTDTDGSQPGAWGYIATYGMAEQSGKDVERFR